MDKKEIAAILKEFGFLNLVQEPDLTEIAAAVNEFLQNPYYAQEYNTCPNNLLKCHEILIFADSLNEGDEDKYDDVIKRLRNLFGNYEWQYLADHTTNMNAKMYYLKQIKA